MSATTRFGHHLLLKKLGEDALGETYRAGRLEGATIGDVVLLRVFGRPGLDTARLHQAFAASAGQRAAGSGPGVIWALDVGEVGGLAYAAYEYLPGRDLASLHRTLAGGDDPLSEDHAVLVVERVAKGLALLHGASPGAPAHGFLTPPLIWVSNEGEAKLLGFEAGPQLAAMAAAGQLPAELTVYLSPEVLHGAAPSERDDVYSLGAILWELLLGAPPTAEAGPFDVQLVSATLTASGGGMPAGLARLLQRSLAPAAERIATIDQWHRELIGWMAEAPVSATTFDLAFFLHELFRDEIRREARDIEKEKNLDLRPSPAPATEETPLPVLDPGRHTVPLDTGSLHRAAVHTADVNPAELAAGGSKTGLIAVVAGLVIVLAAGGYWFLGRSAPAPAPQIAEATPPTPQQPAIDLTATENALDQLMRERQLQMEERLREEYDAQIAALKQQLTEAATGGAGQTDTATGSGAPPSTAAPATHTPAPASAPPPPASPPAAAQEPAAAPPPVSEPSPPHQSASSPAASPPPTAGGTTEPIQTAAPPPPPPAPPPPAAAPPTAVSQPKIQPPALIQRPDPGYPSRARALKREAIVAVKVLVGRDGRVIQAQPVSPQAKDLGFEEAAVKAALKAEYKPARRDGETIEMWTTLVFNFKL